MKVKLLRDARIKHYAGEIIDVSPEECFFLVSTEGAIAVDAVKSDVAPEIPEKAPKAETPEKKMVKRTAKKK